jgi:Glycosyl hydrolases family 28/Pectate lyase superfamily protein
VRSLQNLLIFITVITMVAVVPTFSHPLALCSPSRKGRARPQASLPVKDSGISKFPATSQGQAGQSARGLKFLNVKDYGAVGDGHTLNTEFISRAVKSCSGSGGCVLVFPPGHYVTGTFELLSNVTIYLDPGAVLVGSTNLDDYASAADYGFGRTYGVNSSGEGFQMGMIVAQGVTNVAIVGEGEIDGNGDAFMDFNMPHLSGGYNARFTRHGEAYMAAMNQTLFGPVQPKANGYGRPGTLMVFRHCRNVLLRGVTIQNAPNWTVHLSYCRHAVVTDVRILNNLVIPNDDGIDCINSQNVHISDCDIRTGDDALAIVNSKYVTASNCSLISRSSGIRFANSSYCTFENLTIFANRGIGLFHEKGNVIKDVLFSNLIIRTQLVAGDWWGKGEPIMVLVSPSVKGNDTGYFSDVRFSNIVAESEAGILIYGKEGSPIAGISLQKIKLHILAPAPKIAAEIGGNFDLRGAGVRNPRKAVFKHDIPALYARYVNDLKIQGFEVSWDDNLPKYFSSAIVCQQFYNLEIQGFTGRQARLKGTAPAIALSYGSVVSVRDSDAAPGTGTFLVTRDVTEEGLFVGNDVKNAQIAFRPAKPQFRMYANYLPRRTVARQKRFDKQVRKSVSQP